MNILEAEIGELKTQLINMTLLVRGQLEKAISAFYSFDKNLAKEIIKNEKRVNGSEIVIHAKSEHILALFNPVAIDLRFVVASLKMVSDLERIGDNAKGIAQFIIRCEKPFDEELIRAFRFREMTDTTLDMLSILCESFETDDTQLARSLFGQDELLDEINVNANFVLADYVKKQKDTESILQSIYFLSIIRKMERTGDYITNVAEEIIFYVKAKVLKHKRKHLSKFGDSMDE